MNTLIKSAGLLAFFFVLAACVEGSGEVSFQGQYDPETGELIVNVGGGTTTATVNVDSQPANGTLPGSGGLTDPSGALLDLIMVSPEEDPASFLQSIPEAERNCLVEHVGEDRIEDFIKGTSPGEEEIILQCVSEETVRRVMLGMLAMEAGGLADHEISCLTSTLADVRFLDFIGQEGSLLEQVLLPYASARCLPYEKLESIGIVGQDGQFVHTISQVRCVFEQGDDETLAQLTGANESDAVTQLLENCGVVLWGPGIDGSGEPTEGQPACLSEAIGPDALQELIDGQRTPTDAELEAMSACGINIDTRFDESRAVKDEEWRQAAEELGLSQMAEWEALEADHEAARRALEEGQHAAWEERQQGYEDRRHDLDEKWQSAWEEMDRRHQAEWTALEGTSQDGTNHDYEEARRALEEQQRSEWTAHDRHFQDARDALDDEFELAWRALERESIDAWREFERNRDDGWKELEDRYASAFQSIDDQVNGAWEELDRRHEDGRNALNDEYAIATFELSQQQEADRQLLIQVQAQEWEVLEAWYQASIEALNADSTANASTTFDGTELAKQELAEAHAAQWQVLEPIHQAQLLALDQDFEAALTALEGDHQASLAETVLQQQQERQELELTQAQDLATLAAELTNTSSTVDGTGLARQQLAEEHAAQWQELENAHQAQLLELDEQLDGARTAMEADRLADAGLLAQQQELERQDLDLAQAHELEALADGGADAWLLLEREYEQARIDLQQDHHAAWEVFQIAQNTASETLEQDSQEKWAALEVDQQAEREALDNTKVSWEDLQVQYENDRRALEEEHEKTANRLDDEHIEAKRLLEDRSLDSWNQLDDDELEARWKLEDQQKETSDELENKYRDLWDRQYEDYEAARRELED